MIRRNRAIATLGVALLSAVVLVASPAMAKNRKSSKERAKAAEKVIKARQKAHEAVEKARRKTVETRAKAWKDAVKDTAKARRKAAEAMEKAAKAQRKALEAARSRGRSDRRHDGPSRPGITFGRSDGKFRLGIGVGWGGTGCTICRRWVPGSYVIRTEQVLVEAAHYEWQTQRVEVRAGYYRTHSVAPVTETLYDSLGNPHTVVIETGRAGQVWVPPQYEERRVRVRVPDRYEIRQVRVWVPRHWVSVPVCSHRGGGLSLRALFNF